MVVSFVLSLICMFFFYVGKGDSGVGAKLFFPLFFSCEAWWRMIPKGGEGGDGANQRKKGARELLSPRRSKIKNRKNLKDFSLFLNSLLSLSSSKKKKKEKLVSLVSFPQ